MGLVIVSDYLINRKRASHGGIIVQPGLDGIVVYG
jgi:hypothetical protein